MKATEILSSEHRVIERVIDALEFAADELQLGNIVDAQFFLDASDFIRGFADGCHHRKVEEGVLFETLTRYGFSAETGPVAVMLAEHEQGRLYTRGMREAALRYQSGDVAASKDIIFNANGYAGLLRQHIQKEDQVLFKLADRVIPVSEQDAVLEGFEHVEHEETGAGIHEKYLALADWLESQVAAFQPATGR